MGRALSLDFSGEQIGGGLLNSVSAGLYDNPFHCLREYVQNGFDAHAKRVDIARGPDYVTVMDDGDGMDEAGIKKSIRIGLSEKRPGETVGWRGIGVWSGLWVAQSIVIESKTRGAAKYWRLEIDCDGFRSDWHGQTSIVALVERYVQLSEEDASERDRSFSQVRLEGITEVARALVRDDSGLDAYLGWTLPCTPSPDFKFASDIVRQLGTNVPDYRTLDVQLDDEPIHQPYSNSVEIPKTGRIEDDSGNLVGWYWGCINLQRRKFKEPELQGLVFKHHAFGVGDNSTTKTLFTTPHLMEWAFGEVHVLSPDVVVNTDRTGFENNMAWRVFKEATHKELYSQLEKAVRAKSDEENANERIKKAGPKHADLVDKLRTQSKEGQKYTLLDLQGMEEQLRRDAKKASPKQKEKAGNYITTITQARAGAGVDQQQIERTREKVQKRYEKASTLLEFCRDTPILGTDVQTVLKGVDDSLADVLGRTSPEYKDIVTKIGRKLKRDFKVRLAGAGDEE